MRAAAPPQEDRHRALTRPRARLSLRGDARMEGCIGELAWPSMASGPAVHRRSLTGERGRTTPPMSTAGASHAHPDGRVDQPARVAYGGVMERETRNERSRSARAAGHARPGNTHERANCGNERNAFGAEAHTHGIPGPLPLVTQPAPSGANLGTYTEHMFAYRLSGGLAPDRMRALARAANGCEIRVLHNHRGASPPGAA